MTSSIFNLFKNTMLAKKISRSYRGEITVNEIMLKIKEIAEKKKNGVALEKTSDNDGRNFNFIKLSRSETIFYTFAKKIGRRLKQYGLYGLIEKVKNLFPDMIKYKDYFRSEKFIKKP